MTSAQIISLVAGTLLLGYGLRALRSGRVFSTWGQIAHRPSVIYWITVGAIVLLALVNFVFALRVPALL
jgi:hypothetical protein